MWQTSAEFVQSFHRCSPTVESNWNEESVIGVRGIVLCGLENTISKELGPYPLCIVLKNTVKQVGISFADTHCLPRHEHTTSGHGKWDTDARFRVLPDGPKVLLYDILDASDQSDNGLKDGKYIFTFWFQCFGKYKLPTHILWTMQCKQASWRLVKCSHITMDHSSTFTKLK